MVLKSKTGSEKQKATVQQLKEVLRYVGMRGKKRKITKRRKSLKSLLTSTYTSTRHGKLKNRERKGEIEKQREREKSERTQRYNGREQGFTLRGPNH